MRRVSGKDKKPPVDQEDEPDLYRISQIYPLPAERTSALAPSHQPFASASSSMQHLTDSSEFPSGIRALACSSSQAAASVAPLQAQGNAAAASFLSAASIGRTLGALSNPYAAALAAQLQQSSQQQQQQQRYHQFLRAAQVPFQSFINPSVVNGPYQNSTIQHLLQQYELACLSSLLQGAVGGPPPTASAPAGISNFPANATGETPIMYIPVYPSTFAGLGGVSRVENSSGSCSDNGSV